MTESLFFQVAVWANDGEAVFIREFTLIRRDHLPEEPLHESSQKPEDPVSAFTENIAISVDYHSAEFHWSTFQFYTYMS